LIRGAVIFWLAVRPVNARSLHESCVVSRARIRGAEADVAGIKRKRETAFGSLPSDTNVPAITS